MIRLRMQSRDGRNHRELPMISLIEFITADIAGVNLRRQTALCLLAHLIAIMMEVRANKFAGEKQL